jgi:hypothetical protein
MEVKGEQRLSDVALKINSVTWTRTVRISPSGTITLSALKREQEI